MPSTESRDPFPKYNNGALIRQLSCCIYIVQKNAKPGDATSVVRHLLLRSIFATGLNRRCKLNEGVLMISYKTRMVWRNCNAPVSVLIARRHESFFYCYNQYIFSAKMTCSFAIQLVRSVRPIRTPKLRRLFWRKKKLREKEAEGPRSKTGMTYLIYE